MSLIQNIRDKLSESSYGIAIDDFGKGYAGVDRVIKLQPTIIKLDQIFVNQIDQDVRLQSFIKGLVGQLEAPSRLFLQKESKQKKNFLHSPRWV